MHDETSNSATEAISEVVAPLKFDPDEHRHHLSDETLTIEQQNEILQALWHIMSIFVDIGWGVDTVQIFLPELLENNGPDSEKLVSLDNIQKSELVVTAEKGQNND